MNNLPDWAVEEMRVLRNDLRLGVITHEEYAVERANIAASCERHSDEQDMREAGRMR